MINLIKRNWKIILICVGIFVIIPIIVYGLSVPAILPNGGNDWAGFWGGYLGSVFGGIITLIVMKNTLKQEKLARDREEKIEYFNHIVHITTEAQYAMTRYANCVKEHVRKGLYSIDDKIKVSESNNLSAKINLELQILLETRKEQYALSELSGIYIQMNKIMEKSYKMYTQCIEAKMEIDILSNATCQLLDELCDVINEVEKIVIGTVKKNLY